MKKPRDITIPLEQAARLIISLQRLENLPDSELEFIHNLLSESNDSSGSNDSKVAKPSLLQQRLMKQLQDFRVEKTFSPLSDEQMNRRKEAFGHSVERKHQIKVFFDTETEQLKITSTVEHWPRKKFRNRLTHAEILRYHIRIRGL